MPQMHELKIQPPYILLLDNHRSHNSIEISKFCEEKQIHLLGLHPNATFLQQPLDVAFFHSFKSKWNDLLARLGTQVKRTNVCQLVSSVMAENDFSVVLRSGFKSSGLHPLSKNAIDEKKFIKKSPPCKLKPCVFGANLPIYAKTAHVEVGPERVQSDLFSKATYDSIFVGIELEDSRTDLEPQCSTALECSKNVAGGTAVETLEADTASRQDQSGFDNMNESNNGLDALNSDTCCQPQGDEEHDALNNGSCSKENSTRKHSR